MTNQKLIAALDRLDALFSDESKWTQGKYSRDGAFCIYGGVCNISYSPPTHPTPVLNELSYTLETQGVDSRNLRLEMWNDAPERTFADVKRLIADTRKRLEANLG